MKFYKLEEKTNGNDIEENLQLAYVELPIENEN